MFYGTESYCCSNFRVTALASFLSSRGDPRKTLAISRELRVQEEPISPRRVHKDDVPRRRRRSSDVSFLAWR